MSQALVPKITKQGLKAVFNASHDGFAAKIKTVAFGDGAYTPTDTPRQLANECSRVAISSSKAVGDRQVNLTVMDATDKEYWVREVGFFLEDGTLFAIWSEPELVLAYKSRDMKLILGLDLALSGVPADSVTIIDQGADLNIFYAEELAQMATAQIDQMNRYLRLKLQLLNNKTINS